MQWWDWAPFPSLSRFSGLTPSLTHSRTPSPFCFCAFAATDRTLTTDDHRAERLLPSD